MEQARPAHSVRRARLASRRRQRAQRFGRFIRLTIVGALVPGVGFIAAGKRRLGAAMLTVLVLAILAALMVVVVVPQGKLASYAGDRQALQALGAGLAVAAVVWLGVALATHRSLEPRGLSVGQRLMGSLAVVVSTSVIVAPMAVGARYMFTQQDLIGAIASNGSSLTTPELDEKDPWADKPRLNVLLLGGDGGEGRDGIRPDTQIVASIDTATGETTMISLPRNLQRFPFPPDSPLAQAYPSGFAGQGDVGEWMLNAVYRNVPAAHPELFDEVENPGADANKWAVEGALGLDIDYYVLVNLDGFQALVDALGGITIDVPRDIPIGNKSLPGGGCTRAVGYVEAGPDQHLDGYHALWFARSRCGSDDYDRMERQRCVMNAIVDKADPATLLTQYQRLATATKDIVLTDIPEGMFPALIELTLKVKDSPLRSLSLDNKFFAAMGTTSANPDYDALHKKIADVLAGPSASTDSPAAGTAASSGEQGQAGSGEVSTAQSGATADIEATNDDGTGGGGATTSSPEPTAPDQPVDAAAVC